MRVLLISPLRGLDPPGGDITYTEELISNMGRDVEYVTYDQAIADGSVVELTRRNWRMAPVIAIANKVVNICRRLRLIYWEPFRFFYITPGIYDVVHVHHYPFRVINKSCPIMYSSGAPLGDLYRDRRKYSKRRIILLSAIETHLCRLFDVNHSSYHLPQVDRIAVYTDYYCDYLKEICNLPDDCLVKLPIFLCDLAVNRVEHTGTRFGFVAYDFSSKGGEVLLASFRRVREYDKSASLHIIGNLPDEFRDEEGVTVYGTVNRDFVLRQFFPMIDVFVYPTPQDCFSYVILEALRAGCAICTSDYVSMPEAVDYGKAGLISPVGDVESLASNMIAMLDIDTRLKFQEAARSQFLKKFDSAIVLSKLYEIYSELALTTTQSNRKTE
jgi:glycosyltransferase involved in cell wall biosynthesis